IQVPEMDVSINNARHLFLRLSVAHWPRLSVGCECRDGDGRGSEPGMFQNIAAVHGSSPKVERNSFRSVDARSANGIDSVLRLARMFVPQFEIDNCQLSIVNFQLSPNNA